MKNYIYTIILLLSMSTLLYATDDGVSIKKMWSRTEGNISNVYDVENDSVSINFSELNKWTSSNIKMYGIINLNEENATDGRIIINRDSLGVIHYRVLDYFKLTEDSVKIYRHEQYFADEAQANAAPKIKVTDAKTYYTTEYLYLEKVAKNAPPLKKDDYTNFLKAALADSKKRAEQKTLNIDPKKPIDKRVEEYLFAFSRERQYRGKIFPNTLDAAMKKYAKDESFKKMMLAIKSNFITKKGAEIATADAKSTKSSDASKATAVSTKANDANTIKIKTEEKKKP